MLEHERGADIGAWKFLRRHPGAEIDPAGRNELRPIHQCAANAPYLMRDDSKSYLNNKNEIGCIQRGQVRLSTA